VGPYRTVHSEHLSFVYFAYASEFPCTTTSLFIVKGIRDNSIMNALKSLSLLPLFVVGGT